ncbi:MAG TPA: transcriptional regulator GutM [Lactovum miscens]|uniref:transcriptional regulator GutM n=1 Tax=Lactovum miscens TaxID=190387 RepID=UPI002ED849E1
MSPIITFGALFVTLYLIQSWFSWKQIKAFNHGFQELRRKGKVVVGKRSGHFVAGTVILLLVSPEGKIIEGRKMQGISVFARFRNFDTLNGTILVDLNPFNPLVKKEMKYTRLAIENGRELYIRFLSGAMEPERYSNITPFGINVEYAWLRIKNKFNRRGYDS